MLKFLGLFSLFFCQSLLATDQGIKLADNYTKNSFFQWDVAMNSLKTFPFQQNDKVLDVGSGDGKITSYIAKQVSQGTVVGLDISEKMVLQSLTFFQQKNLLFLQGSAVDIPFREQFDKVVSFSTLHWVLNQEQALQSMKNSIRAGGLMLIVTYGKSPNNLATVAQAIASSPKWSSYFPTFKQERVYYTLEEYKILLQKVNLTIQSIKEIKVAAHYQSKKELVAFIRPLVNFISHLPLQLQEEFIADISNRMVENDPPLPDGSIDIHHVEIEVVAMKL